MMDTIREYLVPDTEISGRISMDIGWKLASAGAGALASLIAGNVVNRGWKLATGKDAPHEDDDEVSIIRLVVFAAVSAVVASLAQRVALQGAKKWYRAKPLPHAELPEA